MPRYRASRLRVRFVTLCADQEDHLSSDSKGRRVDARSACLQSGEIVPTILQACGILEPDMVDGVQQKPIQGVSLAYTFDKANANAPSTHHSQYFEMFGDMGMYKDGWIASNNPFAIPWRLLSNKPQEDVWNKANWRLYHVTEDDDWTHRRKR